MENTKHGMLSAPLRLKLVIGMTRSGDGRTAFKGGCDMITPEERIEKIRSAPRNSERFFRKLTPEQKEERLHRALHHDNDAGLSSSDEHAYLKRNEVEGLEGCRPRR